jgi:hypothetical protein
MKLIEIIFFFILSLFLIQCTQIDNYLDLPPTRWQSVYDFDLEKKLPDPINIDIQKWMYRAKENRWPILDYQYYLDSEEKLSYRSAFMFALENTKDGEITSWYSKNKKKFVKIRPIFSYPVSAGYCREYQLVWTANGGKSGVNVVNIGCRETDLGWMFIFR